MLPPAARLVACADAPVPAAPPLLPVWVLASACARNSAICASPRGEAVRSQADWQEGPSLHNKTTNTTNTGRWQADMSVSD